MESFDQFAQEYKTILDESLKVGGETGDYFFQYKTLYIDRCVGKDFSGRILDYGCGIGLLSGFLVKHFPKARIDGFDVSIESVNLVPAELKEQGLFASDIDSLQAGYDLIVVANVLHHIEPTDRAGVFAQLKKLLAPKGKIIIFEHNPLNPLTRKVVRESPLDRGVVLLPSRETVSYIQSQGLQKRLDYIVFFPKFLSALRWTEPLIRWCPLGAQYVIIGRA